MNRNVGGYDRIVRGVIGTWLLAIAVAAFLDDQRIKAATAAIAGTGLLVNWATGFCGGNALFGITTCPEESRSSERDSGPEAR